MTNIIEISNLTKAFHDTTVLNNIDLTIRSGEFLTILGPSGCGKTSLLRLISGFDEPSSGTICLNGKNMQGVPPHLREVNTVFQSYALFPHMNIYDNVAFGLRCKKVPEDEIKERVMHILRMVKLEQKAYRKPSQLSGGQQQRVAIARAVVNKPLVLLLDEPLSALDYSLRKNMQVELKALQRQLGITFVLVTHDQEEALSMSDRVVVMQEGEIAQVGTPREVYEKPKNLAVAEFVGAANLFETKVIDEVDGKVEIEIEGKRFKVNNTRKLKKGQSAVMLVRPEDLRSWTKEECSDREMEHMIPAVVEQVIYKGSTVDLILRTESQKRLSSTEFFNEDDETLDFNVNERVWIEWMIGWEVLLPREVSHSDE